MNEETLELVATVAQTTRSGFTLTLGEPRGEDAAPNKDPEYVSMPTIYRLNVLLQVARNGKSEWLHFSPPSPGTATQDRHEWQGHAFQLLDVGYIDGRAHASFTISEL